MKSLITLQKLIYPIYWIQKIYISIEWSISQSRSWFYLIRSNVKCSSNVLPVGVAILCQETPSAKKNWQLGCVGYLEVWETNVAICRRIGKLKNNHVGAHRSVPRQPYFGALMYGPSSDERTIPRMHGWTIHWNSDVNKRGGVRNSNKYPDSFRNDPKKHFFSLPTYGPSSDVWFIHTSEDGPYIGGPIFEHAFQRMATFIRSRNKQKRGPFLT